jgi:hypothetical protein
VLEDIETVNVAGLVRAEVEGELASRPSRQLSGNDWNDAFFLLSRSPLRATAQGRFAPFGQGAANGRKRRISVGAGYSGDGLFTEPIAVAQPWQREPLLMPLSRPCRCNGEPAQLGRSGTSGVAVPVPFACGSSALAERCSLTASIHHGPRDPTHAVYSTTRVLWMVEILKRLFG